MKPEITAERLLELGGSLEGIMQELLTAVNKPAPNPQKRRNKKAERMAHYANLLDSRLKKRN